MKALFWDVAKAGVLRCRLCAHQCLLPNGKLGQCAVRRNANGVMETLVSQRVAAVHVDPVEKKPLYHFHPGSKTFSLGTNGCNFSCVFCQNHSISQLPRCTGHVTGTVTTPEILIAQAHKHKADSIAFTYTEPTVFYELMYEVAGLAAVNDLPCIMVSNGYISGDALTSLYHRIHAANIDLKSFNDAFYRQHCGARLQPVLDTLKAIYNMGWWLEVTTLIIPGLNDSTSELCEMAAFLRDELSPDVPWHLSRFHGAFRMENHPTPPDSVMESLWHVAREAGMHYVYLGNMASTFGTATYCPCCQNACITRQGFFTHNSLQNGACPKCGTPIAGHWR